MTLNLTVNGPTDPADLAQRIRQELAAWWRQQGAEGGLQRNARAFD